MQKWDIMISYDFMKCRKSIFWSTRHDANVLTFKILWLSLLLKLLCKHDTKKYSNKCFNNFDFQVYLCDICYMFCLPIRMCFTASLACKTLTRKWEFLWLEHFKMTDKITYETERETVSSSPSFWLFCNALWTFDK